MVFRRLFALQVFFSHILHYSDTTRPVDKISLLLICFAAFAAQAQTAQPRYIERGHSAVFSKASLFSRLCRRFSRRLPPLL